MDAEQIAAGRKRWQERFDKAAKRGLIALDVIDIRCSRATRRYLSVPIDTVWSIPESWGDCGVYMKGEPGTTFSFREHPLSFVPAAAVDVALPSASEVDAPP